MNIRQYPPNKKLIYPTTAQHSLPVEKYVEILAKLKPGFIHHPQSKQLIQGILEESGCDLNKTYFDVPRLRTATSDGYLTSGIAYAFHPHRDTWYSAPQCQINWWLPVYDVTSENVMAFHPRYWNQPVKNSSRDYNYAQWNKESRQTAAKHIKKDTRKQPRAEEIIEIEPQLRLITQVGGMVLFSGAQMHSTVPNTSGYTRFSIDFRTVHFDDAIARKGAPNIDSACTGTSLGDFLRGTFILDEMITGFRWSTGNAQTYYDIVPDLSTFGKSMGNGFAVSALVGKRELMELGGIYHDQERVFLLSTTHGAENHGLAAAIATMNIFRTEGVIDYLYQQGERLRQGINQAIAANELQDYFQVVGIPCNLVYVTRDQNKQASQAFRTLFMQETIKRGLILPSLVVSFSHSNQDIDITIDAISESLKIYRKALEYGIDDYLIGRPVKPVFRKYC